MTSFTVFLFNLLLLEKDNMTEFRPYITDMSINMKKLNLPIQIKGFSNRFFKNFNSILYTKGYLKGTDISTVIDKDLPDK